MLPQYLPTCALCPPQNQVCLILSSLPLPERRCRKCFRWSMSLPCESLPHLHPDTGSKWLLAGGPTAVRRELRCPKSQNHLSSGMASPLPFATITSTLPTGFPIQIPIPIFWGLRGLRVGSYDHAMLLGGREWFWAPPTGAWGTSLLQASIFLLMLGLGI
jgi:hypothetical protein